MRRSTAAWLMFALAAAAAFASVAGSAPRPRPPLHVVLYSAVWSTDVKTDNLECALGVRAVHRYRWPSLKGFAARLTPAQVQRLAFDRDVRRINPNHARYHVAIAIFPPSAAVDEAIDALERRHGFRATHRSNTRANRGFAAELTAAQLAALEREPLVAKVATEPEIYLVFFVPGTDVDARTDELERTYGFQSTVRLRGLEGFGAWLAAPQIAGLAREPDIAFMAAQDYILGGVGGPPEHPACLRAGPGTRRALAAALGPPGRTARVVGRVHYASYLGKQYALASFARGKRRLRGQPVRFERPAGGRWVARGVTGGRVCGSEIPVDVLRVWLLRPLDGDCYSSGTGVGTTSRPPR